jgi:hypothetical protein
LTAIRTAPQAIRTMPSHPLAGWLFAQESHAKDRHQDDSEQPNHDPAVLARFNP